ncbi:hypothetical protein L1887_16662 [Cichorium endivia]|nr:hypothetical protein L1887_16662 [Cichorium endivia]
MEPRSATAVFNVGTPPPVADVACNSVGRERRSIWDEFYSLAQIKVAPPLEESLEIGVALCDAIHDIQSPTTLD